MKISWFSPLPQDHTEIANYTARLLPALNRHFETEIWTSTEDYDEELGGLSGIQAFDYSSMDWKRLNLGGIPVYHIGNNIHFHGEIIRVAQACPGIVVLHDLAMHETAMNLCLYRGHGRPEYFDILYRHGGKEAVELGRRFLDKREIDTNELSTRYPLFEYVISNARGIITHNPLSIGALRACSPAPVMYAPLPYVRRSELREPVKRRARADEPYRIIMFGFLGSSNRRLKPFLEAFSSCKCKDRYHVSIAGKYPEKDVRQWIRKLSLENHVTTHGFVTEEFLETLLTESDLCINLRWPSRGESSATLLRIWNHSLPAIVTDTDYYSTLPKDAVVTVDPANELDDIRTCLDDFANDPAPYFEKGLAARQRLEREHSTDAFAQFLMDFLPMVEASKGIAHAQAAGKAIANRFLSGYPDPVERQRLTAVCAGEISRWITADNLPSNNS